MSKARYSEAPRHRRHSLTRQETHDTLIFKAKAADSSSQGACEHPWPTLPEPPLTKLISLKIILLGLICQEGEALQYG